MCRMAGLQRVERLLLNCFGTMTLVIGRGFFVERRQIAGGGEMLPEVNVKLLHWPSSSLCSVSLVVLL